MFIIFGVSILPKTDSFRYLILNLTRSEITIKPLFLCTQICQGIPVIHMDSFWNLLSTADVYQNLNPTPQKAVDKFNIDKENLRPSEANTLYYFNVFVYSSSSDVPILFLLLATWLDVLPRDDIQRSTLVLEYCVYQLHIHVKHPCAVNYIREYSRL
ncbi:unnamed protein product [Mytilus coruscus]|uniref:Uncharacterized protein n=1 Tax=Mytilus coruscus TaxID=42192 RepID=A0A6J8DHQ0_MYTCO|nr:unnamed protein product [Mytilus coruscus]